jgi:hypothetical protein
MGGHWMQFGVQAHNLSGMRDIASCLSITNFTRIQQTTSRMSKNAGKAINPRCNFRKARQDTDVTPVSCRAKE